MIKSRYILISFLFLFQTALIAQPKVRTYYADDDLVPREHGVDMLTLKLEASFEPTKNTIHGLVTHTFKVLQKKVDSMVLDAVNINIESMELDGKTAKYKNTGKELYIYFPKPFKWETEHSLKIKYNAQPLKGLYFVGWDDESNRSRKQIWSQGQGVDNRYWIPMYDTQNDKIISEMIVSFDKDYKVLSNGKLLGTKNLNDGKKQWHYKISHPHPSYLIMLGIGKYAIDHQKSKSGVPLNYYYYPDQPNQLEPTYRYSTKLFNFLEDEIGVPYPWGSYSQIPVQDFMYGAMENTTATVFGDFYLVDNRTFPDRNYVRVDAHELTHQWFGDMVTARSGAHHWLQEGFATHFDMTFQNVIFGKDYFDWVRRNYNNQALAASKKNLKPIANSTAGSARFYPKSAFVLQMLKYVIGRDQFNKAIRYYVHKHAYGNVDSHDLLIAFHESLGLSLDWFWEEWVYKGGEPAYTVNFENFAKKGVFNVSQTHEQNDLVGLFKMPIVFQIFYTDGSKQEKTVWIDKENQRVEFKLETGKAIDYVLFDPDNEVMKKVTFEKPKEMLIAQAGKAKDMLDRYDALVLLADSDFQNKDEFLVERFKAETFYGIKNEIIQQLLPKMNAAAFEVAKLAIANGDSKVKAAIVNNSIRVPEEWEGEYRKLLTDSSYQVIEKVLKLLSFYYPNNINHYLEVTKGVQGNRAHNVEISWLKIAYESTQDQKYVDQLVDYTSNSFEFLTRINASDALKALNYLDESALKNMLNATFSFNRRLTGPVKGVLEYFYVQENYKRMILTYVSNQNWTDSEFKKVTSFLRP